MNGYLFIFGRTPALSEMELATFFPKRTLLDSSVALVDQQLTPNEVIEQLGGTVKIAQVLDRVSSISAHALAPFIDGRTFGVSMYPEGKMSRRSLEEMKRLVPGSQFVEAREGDVLSSVVIEKRRVSDLVIIKDADGYLIGKTVVVQAFEEWNRRDYQRPFADPASGMLPPKVARMVVNIARHGTTKGVLLDPFCGMGTILAEAMLMGADVIGIDQSSETIVRAKANLDWLRQAYAQTASAKSELFVGDAVHSSKIIPNHSIDAIVTEPFMGKTITVGTNIKNIIKGLEKLYIGCLKEWQTVLRAGGRVVIALPEYHVGGKTYFVKKVIDSSETLGYTTLAGPIEYSRPQAIVRREFFIFIKK